jgi:bifunctional non-homologous end joining protein LigD
MAQLLEKDDPKHITANMRKDLRHQKVFIDWSQNDDHKTTVSAYSLRARSDPTVSTPVSWDELESALKRKALNRLVFHSDDVLARVEQQGDLFEPVLNLKQKLPVGVGQRDARGS